GGAVAQLRDVFRRPAGTCFVLRSPPAEHVLVQRRLRGLPAELQLGNGAAPGARAETAEPPARLELRRALGLVRAQPSVLLDLCGVGAGGAPAQVPAGEGDRRRDDGRAGRRRRLRRARPPRRRTQHYARRGLTSERGADRKLLGERRLAIRRAEPRGGAAARAPAGGAARTTA